MRVAGIDIGTLTCRLLVAAVFPEAEDPIHTIRSERKILRLGKGSTGQDGSNRRPCCA